MVEAESRVSRYPAVSHGASMRKGSQSATGADVARERQVIQRFFPRLAQTNADYITRSACLWPI